ncbi:MAG: hydroxyacid dehydrogenase [Candidatus Promineifilaceae bacterium]|nr:hydroxyacid dehydrogenase [Candidatus Promineifilaceae bacterium]
MKVLIASSIYPEAIETLREEHDVVCAFSAKEDVLKEVIVDREVIILRSGVQITADVMACAPDLKLLLRAGSGFDNIDVDYVNEHGLELIRIPGPGAKAVAEMSFTFMLALARNLLRADSLTRQGHWAKHQLTGELLTGKRLGIVGAGNIGTQVGKLGVAWGMEAIGCVEPATPEEAERLKAEGIRMTDFDEVISTSDFISIHVPLMDSTRNLIDKQELALMKPGAYLVNLARGGVVNESALYDALTEGTLAGAGVDVHANEGEGKISPLASLPNVILTPHIGAGTIDSQREIGDIVINILRTYEVEKIAA